MDTLRKLKEAVTTGEVIEIIYHAGSKPGTVRSLAILQVNEDKYRARCYDTNKVKVFKIDKTEIPTNTDPEHHHRNERDIFDDSPTLPIFAKAVAPYITQIGLIYKATQNEVAAYRMSRNGSGKVLTKPEAFLAYRPHVLREGPDPVTGADDYWAESDSPWVVHFKSDNRTTRFKHMDHAARKFFWHILDIAPNQEAALSIGKNPPRIDEG